jgi:hypothetical protein
LIPKPAEKKKAAERTRQLRVKRCGLDYAARPEGRRRFVAFASITVSSCAFISSQYLAMRRALTRWRIHAASPSGALAAFSASIARYVISERGTRPACSFARLRMTRGPGRRDRRLRR